MRCCALLCCCGLLHAIACAPSPTANSPAEDRAALTELKTTKWPRAYLKQDVELLAQILHPSFQLTDVNGETSSRTRELELLETTPWRPAHFEYNIERLEIYEGRFAVVAGRGCTDSSTYVSSNHLVKEDGRWRAISSHVSGYVQFDEDPMAARACVEAGVTP